MSMPKKSDRKYEGNFVAKTSCNGRKIIAAGKDPLQVYNEAKKETKEPFIYFVAPKKTLHLF